MTTENNLINNRDELEETDAIQDVQPEPEVQQAEEPALQESVTEPSQEQNQPPRWQHQNPAGGNHYRGAQGQYYAQQHYAPPQPPVPTRRVGTITMGLSLIVAGLVSVYSLLNPGFDIIMVAKLAPIILVFIGIEIIIAHFWGKGSKLKYDWLSGFVCFILISAALSFAVATPLINYYGPERHRTEQRVSKEVYDIYYAKLRGNTKITSMNVYLSLNGIEYSKDMTAADLNPGDHMSVTINMTGDYTTKEDFAKDVRSILTRLGEVDVFDTIYFTSEGDKVSFSLRLNDKFQRDSKAERLAEMVEVYVIIDGYIYDDENGLVEQIYVEGIEQDF